MEQAQDKEPSILQEDGCYVDGIGIQHYLFPREFEQIEDEEKLALYEFVWHLNPEWQGQYDDDTKDEVEIDSDSIKNEVDRLARYNVQPLLFPRELFAQQFNNDWDKVAFAEYHWYFFQAEGINE